jgi:SAM-dependent methyltransferase
MGLTAEDGINMQSECPACGARSAAPIIYWKWGYPILRCKGCGLGSTGLDHRQFNAQDIYSNQYFTGGQKDGYADYLGSEATLRGEFRRLVRSLHNAGRRTGKLFEIGCAYGFFLMEARKTFAVSGVEACAEAAAFCRARGLDVDAGLVTEDLLAAHGPMDAVVMLDVIEHLTDPLAVLQMAYRNLTPGGHLLITTGDWDSLLSRFMRSSWRLMTPPQHVYFFSRKTIRAILSRAGFRVVSIDRPGKRVPASLILFQLMRIAGMKPKSLGSLSDVSLPVNLFDAMRVIAVREN